MNALKNINGISQPDNVRSEGVVFFTIILAQFCGTSLWFAGNAIVNTLQEIHHWPTGSVGHLTTAVQAGFITGTFVVTLTGVADRISPVKLFFLSCTGGALCNSLSLLQESSFSLALVSRMATGFFLGGIYPVGMKIASDWRQKGLGDWLGALVGALVLGTALPHALRIHQLLNHPSSLLIAVSATAFLGGGALFFIVPDGPFRKKSSQFSFRHVKRIFSSASFRAPVFGYFGHMWELYTFWALVPWIVARYITKHALDSTSVSLLSFTVIAVGGFGCWAGGKLSVKTGSFPVARVALSISGLCCVISPFMWQVQPLVFFTFLTVWGTMVVADSPQFSALIAALAPAENRGTALTMTVCIGFAITIVSIQIVNYIGDHLNHDYLLLLLAPGPILGLFMSRKII